ncbi:MAG: hypothetical protein ABFD10_03210 [Prolixibacteraceae bacterium]
MNNHFSYLITVFHGKRVPEEGYLVGYGSLIEFYDLQVPLPDRLALISPKIYAGSQPDEYADICLEI